MAKHNDDIPAFPQHIAEIHGIATHSGEFAMGGMTLRDYFAAQAMVGMLASQKGPAFDTAHPIAIAAAAYRYADALLAARVKQPQEA